MAQLEDVAEQDEPVDAVQARAQDVERLRAAEDVGAAAHAEVQVGDDERAHGAGEATSQQAATSAAARSSRMRLGSMKRTSSRTTSNSDTSSTPRSVKKATSRSTSSSGALAPDEMPTTRLPASHSSRTWAALSIRCASQPRSRATSTRRCEFDEFCEPMTSTRSHSVAICLTAAWRFVVA